MKNKLPDSPKLAVITFLFGIVLVSVIGYFQHDGKLFGDGRNTNFELVTLGSFDDFNKFFESHDFSVKAWRLGEQKVPRLILLDIPEAWAGEIAPTLPTEIKKIFFFSFAIPIVLLANEEILKDRVILYGLDVDVMSGQSARWLRKKAKRYNIQDLPNDREIVTELKRRIDVIPASIAIAQMAEESGWGTSRFAAEGNALYGQWSFKGGMKPLGQRAEKGDYRIQKFESPLDSVRAYMLNLNSNKAYSEFRQNREFFRNKHDNLSGDTLVQYLSKYSERGEKYIMGLTAIISVNQLLLFDNAQLDNKPSFHLSL